MGHRVPNTWSGLPGNPINVLDPKWGAKGDSNLAGTSGTEDHAAINAAIAAAPSGSAVYFPRTSGAGYLLSSPVLADHDDIALIFEPGSKLILAPGANCNVIRGNSTADTTTNGVIRKGRLTIRDLYVEMNGASQSNVAGGIDGALALPAFDVLRLDNVQVHNSKNTAFELRGSTVVRAQNCIADGVYSGNNGNGFNVGRTGSVVGVNAILQGCVTSGVQDVAFWLGGSGARRMSAIGCVVRSDTMRFLTDGAITSGSSVFTSSTASFTANDVGKTITINGAGVSGAALTCRIFSLTNATTVALTVNAATTVSGATFSFGDDGAPVRQVADGNITSGTGTLTSATANFTAADIQKGVFVVGAGTSGANKVGKITAVTNATTATVDFTAGTTVTNGIVRINCTSSGISSEGSNLGSNHLAITGSHVVGTVNTGIGMTDANVSVVGSKHDQATIATNTVADTYGTAMWITGTQHSLGPNVIDNYHEAGLLIGGGNDFDEHDFTVNGGSIKAASDATGDALKVQKDGGNTNWLSAVTLNGTILDGNAAGGYGVKLEGRIRTIQLIGVVSRRFKKSGCWIGAKNGASPVDVTILGGDYRNNNQGGNAAGQDSVGIACEASADNITILGVRAIDDQTVKTQTHGLHWLSATRGTIVRNDFRGNATAAANFTFDSKTIYSENKEVDADYEGAAALVAGTVTVSTAAVRGSGAGHWTPIDLSVITPGGTQGALYVSAVSTGTSFTVKSTSNTDTSTFFWRIR